jgi:hypothetical protein
MLKIDLVAADTNSLAHAKAVSEHHEIQQMVADAMPAFRTGPKMAGRA